MTAEQRAEIHRLKSVLTYAQNQVFTMRAQEEQASKALEAYLDSLVEKVESSDRQWREPTKAESAWMTG